MAQTADVSMPRDDDSVPVQVLCPASAGNVHITASEGASTSASVPSGAAIVRIAASGPVWAALGPSGVDAGQGQSDTFLFPAGAEVFYLKNTYTDLAVRSVSGAGSVVVTITRLV